jgi:thiamine biosynthesis lipoprotein
MISEVNHKNNTKRKLQFWGFSFLVTFGLFLIGCDEQTKPTFENSMLRYEIEGEAQGTTYHIVYFTDSLTVSKGAIDSILDNVDDAASIWVESSIISRVNKSSELTFEINDDEFGYFSDNFHLSKEVYYNTDGAYNPTVGELVNAWGFGFKNREKMDSTLVDSLLQSVGFDDNQMWVSIDSGLVMNKTNLATNLDFNGIAQGYSVDVLANYFLGLGLPNYMIEVGGELIAHGSKSDGNLWKIGIDKPVDQNNARDLAATIELKNFAVATSGNYRKYYEEDGMRYAHTLNPKTGFPVQHSLLSATLIMKNCGLADAYATSFMVMGFEKAKDLIENNPELGIEAYLIYSDENGDMKTYFSPGLKDMLVEL